MRPGERRCSDPRRDTGLVGEEWVGEGGEPAGGLVERTERVRGVVRSPG